MYLFAALLFFATMFNTLPSLTFTVALSTIGLPKIYFSSGRLNLIESKRTMATMPTFVLRLHFLKDLQVDHDTLQTSLHELFLLFSLWLTYVWDTYGLRGGSVRFRERIDRSIH